MAFGLRVWSLGTQSIWYDEGLSWYYASQSLDNLLSLVAGNKHPPFYFLCLHLWQRLTTMAAGRPGSEFLLRFPSLLTGVLLVPLVYAVGCALLSRRAAVLVALLTAASPFQVWYAQEARGYALLVLLAWAASYHLLRLIGGPWIEDGSLSALPARDRSQKRGREKGHKWWLYALLLGLGLYTHLYAIFTILAHALFVAWWAWRNRKWRVWWAWTAWTAVAGAAFLPHGLKIVSTLGANDTYWRGALELSRVVAQVIHACAVGEAWHGPAATALTALYLLLAALGLAWLSIAPYRVDRPEENSRHSHRTAAVFLAASIVVPLVALLLIAYGRPKFAPR